VFGDGSEFNNISQKISDITQPVLIELKEVEGLKCDIID
jgi:hypothetical protein